MESVEWKVGSSSVILLHDLQTNGPLIAAQLTKGFLFIMHFAESNNCALHAVVVWNLRLTRNWKNNLFLSVKQKKYLLKDQFLYNRDFHE